jgi:hypothetical protein
LKPKDFALANALRDGLRLFDKEKRSLPGISTVADRDVLIEQLIESIHRIKYIAVVSKRDVSPLRADPTSPLFDPERAAILRKRQNQIDEAFWFVFLSVYFGKNARGGWRYACEVYGRLGNGAPWDWARTSADPNGFRQWMAENQHILKRDGVPGGFGNHRKYESLAQTASAVESYINWIGPHKSHQMMVQDAINKVGNDRRKLFDYFYRSIDAVKSFGRTAKFDYLTMIGKLDLAPIEPGSTYMQGATGPLAGARLLFGGSTNVDLSRAVLDAWLVELDTYLEVGMQVLEDSLCNWQKSPAKFKPFRGQSIRRFIPAKAGF